MLESFASGFFRRVGIRSKAMEVGPILFYVANQLFTVL